MSFASEVKDQLIHVQAECSQCNVAMLAALIRVEGSIKINGPGRYGLEIVTDAPQAARFMVKELHERFQARTEITVRRSVLHKTPNWLIEVPSQPGLNETLVALGVITSDGGLERGIAPGLVENRCCQQAYLRGVFMAAGFVSNPKGDFHLEMTCVSQQMAEDVIGLMAEFGIEGKITLRRNTHVVYLKRGAYILDFLAAIGAHQAVLDMESARVIKSVRNDVNRQVNAEIANQAKTQSASLDQIRVIRKVLRYKDIRDLPEALQDYIRLRVTNPDATLRELGELADPPLSKSAIYHRVRRLEQMADKMR